jgi:hypothetical protein
MNQHTTITRKHVNKYANQDSCFRHGIGISKCRVCLKSDKVGDLSRGAKHRKMMETLTGYPRIGL